MKKLILSLSLSLVFVALFAQDLYDKHQSKALQLISQMTVTEKIDQLLNDAPGIDHLGISSYNWWNEALHGVARSGRATVFPQPIALGATFDTKLVQDVATAIADEGRAKYNIAQQIGNRGIYAGLTYWSPNVNIFRDPRWGRGMETYGEDPYLSGKIGVAFVKGLQGDHPFFLKSAACAKHYAVHSGPEALRHEFNVDPTKKDLYETYLPAFEMLVKEGKVESIMGAYNAVYNESASGSKFLLTDILRDEWGFDGHVVSDCGAIADIYQHHKIVETAEEAAALALKSGLDLNCGWTYKALHKAFEDGMVSEEDIDKALLRLYMTRMKLGILPGADSTPYDNIPEEVITSDKHADIAREAAQKGMVLLENKNNTLPIDKNTRTMYVAGPYATDAFLMLGNYFGMSHRMSTYLEGIVAKVSSGTSINYKMGFQSTVPNVNDLDWAAGEVRGADVSIVFLGLSNAMEGEEGDAISSPSRGDKIDLAIPEHHIQFLREVTHNNNNKVVAVVTGGSPMDLREVSEMADAVIMAWYPGQEGGWALGDILFGDVSPSGRLPITFPEDISKLPDFEDYTMKDRTYKYMKDNVFYPFGYGLTYGEVNYDNISLKRVRERKKEDIYQVTAEIKNDGSYSVEEVVQLYLSTPNAGKNMPLNSLVDFERVKLNPGESKTVTFDVPKNKLLMVQDDGSKKYMKGVHTFSVSSAAPSNRSKELGTQTLDVTFKL